MPTYDYQCTTCGAVFEFVQSMKDDALTLCPEAICQQPHKGTGNVSRKITGGTGVIYKGAGFYKTDYVDAPATAKSTPGTTTATPNTTESPAADKPAPAEPSTSSASKESTSSE